MNEAQKRRTHEIIYRAQAQKTLENVIYQELIANFGFEGMKGIAEPMIKRILDIVEEYDANHALMRPGELLWLAMDKDQKFGYGKPTCLCKLKVVKLKLWTQEEQRRIVNGETERGMLADRSARLLKDAYAQGGVLSLVDVGLITGASYRRVADLLRGPYREKHQEEVLPMMGTVFDIGRATSHKATAVRLHLQGLLITEISKRMDHHPQRVQRYIDDFQRVAELLDKQVQLERITFITGLQTAVVKQYIELYERSKQEAEQYPYLGEWLELEYSMPKEPENGDATKRSID